MVLGEGMHAMGAKSDRIAASQPGVGYIIVEGLREPIRVRASYVTDEDIKAQALNFPAPAAAAVAIDGGAAQ